MIKLRILWEEIILAQCNYKGPQKREAGGSESQKEVWWRKQRLELGAMSQGMQVDSWSNRKLIQVLTSSDICAKPFLFYLTLQTPLWEILITAVHFKDGKTEAQSNYG